MITYTNVEPEFGVKEKTNPQSLTLTGIQSSRGRHAWLHIGDATALIIILAGKECRLVSSECLYLYL